MLSILGVGLPRTGTQSLSDALEILGLRSIHHEPERLDPWKLMEPDFSGYDDVDAVIDAPASYFYRELTEAYPGLKYILTVRDEHAWWRSIGAHVLSIHSGCKYQHIEYTDRIHALLFGSTIPIPWLWKRAFRDWNEQAKRDLAGPNLLVMDITQGDGWRELCAFLGRPIPDCPFPHANRMATPV